ncbi:hypothetical protein Hanom_Chr15g01392211 [Helianthus anomalus]
MFLLDFESLWVVVVNVERESGGLVDEGVSEGRRVVVVVELSRASIIVMSVNEWYRDRFWVIWCWFSFSLFLFLFMY